MNAERVADRRQQDVAARLVRLGLECEADAISAVDDVLRERVEALAVAVEGGTHVLRGVGLGALASAPEDVCLGAELGGQVEVAHDLAERVPAHSAVVAGERAVLEHGVEEQVRRDHRHDEPRLFERRPEPLDQPFALAVGRAHRHHVVVVEADAVRAELGQPVHRLDRVEGGASGVAEGVAGLPPTVHRPKEKRSSHVGVTAIECS